MSSESNYSGNIIVNLASLPEFLRKPILKKRMIEFFSMTSSEKLEIINNAIEAGPTIPFANFAKLFKTWLEIISIFSEIQRNELFSFYIQQVVNKPEQLIRFHMDGIFEIFMSLESSQREVLTKSLRDIILGLDEIKRNRLLLIIPDSAKRQLRI